MRKIGQDDLKEMFGMLEVFEARLAHVPQADLIGERILAQIACCLREEHLAAMPGGGDAGGAMDVYADVVVTRDGGRASMESDANGERCPVGPGISRERPCRLRCRPYRVFRAREGDEERIALRIHFDAIVRGPGGAEQALVVVERGHVARAEPLEQACRAFDVAKQECDGARR